MQLTTDNYFSQEANLAYMSNSQRKGFKQCEAKEKAKLRGEWEDESRDCFLQGKYVHAWNEGKLDQFREENPEMFKKDGSLYAKYEICETVIECIKADNFFMAALAGEKEVIFTAEMYGTPWKILIDSYLPSEKRFGDLKVLKSIDDKYWNKELQLYENVFEYYEYYTQMAIYAEVEKTANGREDHYEPFIAVATKEKYPDKEIVSFVSDHESHADFISRELGQVSADMPRILAVKTGKETPIRCGKCDYCRSTKKLTGTVHYTAFNLY